MSTDLISKIFNKVKRVSSRSVFFRLFEYGSDHLVILLYAQEELHILSEDNKIKIYPAITEGIKWDAKTFPPEEVWNHIKKCRSLSCIYWNLKFLWRSKYYQG